MGEERWTSGIAKSLSIYLSGDGLDSFTQNGEPIVDDTFLLMINSDESAVVFTLPEKNWGRAWFMILDTAADFFEPNATQLKLLPFGHLEVKGLSMVLLVQDK